MDKQHHDIIHNGQNIHLIFIPKIFVNRAHAIFWSGGPCAERALLAFGGVGGGSWLRGAHIGVRTPHHLALHLGVSVQVIIKTVEPHSAIILRKKKV
jgi:hypothetical protein